MPYARFLKFSGAFGTGSVYGVGFVVQSASVYLLTPAITRALGVADYGVLASALVGVQLVAIVVGLGLPAAITRSAFSNETASWGIDVARQIGSLASFISIGLGGMLAISLLAWGPVALGRQDSLSLGVLVVSAGVGAAIVNAYSAILRAEHRAKAFVLCGFIATAGGQIVGLALIWFSVATATVFMTGVASTTGVAAGLSALAAGWVMRLPRLKTTFWAMRVGLPTVSHAIALHVLHAGDRWLIAAVLGVEQTGRYQVAYVVGAVGLSGLSAINNAWAPLIYGEGAQTRWRRLADTTKLAEASAGVFAVWMALLGPYLLTVVAPASFVPMELTVVLGLVSLSALPYAVYLSGAHILFHEGRTITFAWLTPVSAAANAALNIFLLPRWGLEGAAGATVIAYIVQAWGVRKVGGRLVRVEFDGRHLLLVSAVSCIGVCLSAVIGVGHGLGAALRAASCLGLSALIVLIYRIRSAGPGRAVV